VCGYLPSNFAAFLRHGKLKDSEKILMATYDSRIARMQKSLRWFENDVPLLNMRVKELSKERQESARKFAAAVIDETRAELTRLLQEQPHDDAGGEVGERPCEPAD
jgi:hypothetical protein